MMMNPWSSQLSAQIVDRMQREGVEVVEIPFEREWQPGPLMRIVQVIWRSIRQRDTALEPKPAQSEPAV
jgi:hypothetical protein